VGITGTPDELNMLIETLGQIPLNRGETDKRDPVTRRFEELIDVYGESLKAIIREEAGDGIMSAINCTLHINKVLVKKVDLEEARIVITIDGKFLPYHVENEALNEK